MITWVFAICLLGSDGQCQAYIPQTNFAYLPVEEARVKCAGMLKEFGVGDRNSGQINVCVKARQLDQTYGKGARM